MEMNGGFLVTKINSLVTGFLRRFSAKKISMRLMEPRDVILYVLWQEDGISIRSLSVKCGLAITSLNDDAGKNGKSRTDKPCSV